MTTLQEFFGFPPDAHCLSFINFSFGLNFKFIAKVDGVESKATGPKRQHLSCVELCVLHSKGSCLKMFPPNMKGGSAGQESIKSLH